MSGPVIILGAGASYDYVPEEHRTRPPQFRPPLVKDLFNPHNFGSYLEKHTIMRPLTSSVSSRIGRKKDFESILLELRDEPNPERQRQFVDLHFYLRELFQEITSHYGPQTHNNYDELISRIRASTGEACILTFNYDSLLEFSIPGLDGPIEKRRIEAYITGPIKLVKLHGSCDWRYYYRTMFPEEVEIGGGIFKFLLQNPDVLLKRETASGDVIGVGTKESQAIETNRGTVHNYFYPAIAIPLPKKDRFVTPTAHLEVMRAALSQADKILIVGWKATDQNLLTVIAEEVKQPVRVTVVCAADGEEVKARLNTLSHLVIDVFEGGLTDFLRSDDADRFFKGGLIRV